MVCPNDNTTLAITDRQGVEIDYCPTCRGVWLDRGELDKIIDRSESNIEASPQPRQQYSQQQDYGHSYDSRHKKRKRESFLGDLFDF